MLIGSTLDRTVVHLIVPGGRKCRSRAGASAIKNKHKRINRSQEVIQKANIFINREKNEINNTNVNNKNENINQNNINVKTNINIIIKDKEQIKDNSFI